MNNYTTLWRILVFSAVVSLICSLTLTDWGSWSAIVASIIVVIGVIIGSIFKVKYFIEKHMLFKVENEQPQGAKSLSYEVESSDIKQRIHISITMHLKTTIQHIGLYFDGDGTLPEILGLDDWYWGLGKKDDNISVYEVPNAPHKGTWFWNYKVPNPRFKTNKITIGLDYLATNWFKGNLVFSMTTNDAKKDKGMPFKVIKRVENK